MRALPGRDARAVVAHAKLHFPVPATDRQLHRSFGRIAQCIAHQVLQHQRDPRRIQVRARFARHLDAQPRLVRKEPLAQRLRQFRQQHIRAIERRVCRAQSFSIQQRLDDVPHLQRVLAQRAHRGRVLQQRKAQVQPRDRRAQFMAHAQQQLPLRLECTLDLAGHGVDVRCQRAQFILALRADAMREMPRADVGRACAYRRQWPEQPAYGKVGAEDQQQREAHQDGHQRRPVAGRGDLRRDHHDLVATLDEAQVVVLVALGEVHALQFIQQRAGLAAEIVAGPECQRCRVRK